jgi:transaldolase
MTLLDKLRAHSEIVPETAEIATVKAFGVKHVSLSASRITAAAQLPEHASIVDDAVAWAQKAVGKGGNRKLAAMRAVERLSVEFAQAMAGVVEGTVSIEVDGRLAYKRRPTIDRARALIAQLEELGVDKSRILLKIPATWDGIEAATLLTKKDGIGCHLTLVFGMHQLAAAADAGAVIIAPAVGRVSDAKAEGDTGGADDPGVRLAVEMYDYLARHGYASKLMPGTFRSIDQAVALAGCDYIALAPKQLALLGEANPDLDRKVKPDGAGERGRDKLTVDATSFATMHSADAVSSSKLLSSVQNLSWAVVGQEKQLTDWIVARQEHAAESNTAALFRIWDYDGDGFIDREEWSGTEEVFNALDRDNNGRISLEEMAIGLGAPYSPEEK